jgi:hypothetical protein
VVKPEISKHSAMHFHGELPGISLEACGLHHGPVYEDRPGAWLVNLCAAALNEKKQHNYKKHAANYSNHGYVVHVDPPFCLLGKILLKRLCHDDRLGANRHHEKRG